MLNNVKQSGSARSRASILQRLVMLFNGDWCFINYRKKFNGQYPVRGLFPSFDRYWMGNIWQLSWRGYSISVDMRKDWVADMVNSGRSER